MEISRKSRGKGQGALNQILPAAPKRSPKKLLEAPWFYSAFGLGLQAEHPIPGLVPLPGLPKIDVEISLDTGEQAWSSLCRGPHRCFYVSDYLDRHGQPVLHVWKVGRGGHFWFRYSDGIEFIIDRQAARIWGRQPEQAAGEEVAWYLLGPILGFVLRLRGVMCLHASAVIVGGRALAFMGPQGAGKSTTAAIFARWGYPVLADDVVAVREQGGAILAFPASPRLALWPEAVQHLYASPDALPRLTPVESIDSTFDKRRLDLTAGGYHFQSEPLPLGAIYILSSPRRPGPPSVEPLDGGRGMMALARNTYRADLLDKKMLLQEFKAIGRLAATIPLRQVTPSADLAYFLSLGEIILQDFQSLSAAVL
jgi:hypothetical protein